MALTLKSRMFCAIAGGSRLRDTFLHILARTVQVLFGICLLLIGQTVCADSVSNGVYGGYVGSSAWFSSARDAARQRALAEEGLRGGQHGGCVPLPAGWAMLDATLRFPPSYGGYSAWVNMAELLPSGRNLKAFLAGKSVTGAYMQPAIKKGNGAVVSQLCAPAGHVYWVIADSGTARVAVGRLRLEKDTGTYKVELTAPELTRSSTKTNNASHSMHSATLGTTLKSDQRWQPPVSGNDWKPPTSDNAWKPPVSDGGR